jgi:succinyl-CoA synthetase beta subunit
VGGQCLGDMRFCGQLGADMVKKLYKLLIATDATLVEVNPLCETNDGR